jgi:hypothetical protein
MESSLHNERIYTNSVVKELSFAHLTSSENMLNEIFSHLPGNVIVHKIATLNKRIRLSVMKLEPFG